MRSDDIDICKMSASDPHIVYAEEPVPVIPNVSLGEFIMHSLQSRGNALAQVDLGAGEEVTYAQILSRSIALAQSMRRLGIRSGDVVGVSSENCVDFCIVIIATQLLGAISAPYNPLYTEGELLHSLGISRPRVVFASGSALSRVSAAARGLDCVREVVLIGRDAAPPGVSGHRTLSELLLWADAQQDGTFVPARVDPHRDTAIILSSSGTTGLPKGVELTHQNFVLHLHYMRWMDSMQEILANGECLLGAMPFYHGYGLTLFLTSIVMGIKYVFLKRFEERTFLKTIQDYKTAVLFLAPPLVLFLAKHPMVAEYDLSHVRTVFSGAAPLSKKTEELIKDRFRIQDVRQLYGMTESSLTSTFTKRGQLKSGSSGRLLPGFSAKIIDIETGRSLPRHEVGELWILAPNVMKGYRDNPSATMEAVDKDGWLHTGDIAYFDDDGDLFIVDRLKEVIKYKGYQVSPAELEAILCAHEEIREAGVVGAPNEACGEVPCAFVALQESSKLTEREILDYVSGEEHTLY